MLLIMQLTISMKNFLMSGSQTGLMLTPRLILKVSRKESSRICLLSFPLTLPLILTRPNTGPGLSSNFDLNKSTWSMQWSPTHEDHDSQKKKPGLRFIRPVDAVPLQEKTGNYLLFLGDLWQWKRGGDRKSEWIIWKRMIKKRGEKINRTLSLG